MGHDPLYPKMTEDQNQQILGYFAMEQEVVKEIPYFSCTYSISPTP
jgi:hypothetical protein